MATIKIGITIGDINGIGLEVILKTFSDNRILQLCTPIIYGSAKVVSYHKNLVGLDNSIQFHKAHDISEVRDDKINVIDCWTDDVKIDLGAITEDGGKFAFLSLEKCTEDLSKNHIHAMITGPINKKAMQMANFPFQGHTEFLQSLFSTSNNSLMLLVNDELRVGLVTNHVPIADISSLLTEELIVNKIHAMHRTLRMDFSIEKPIIAVLGLNPHASDNGAIGNEDLALVKPAIDVAKANGIMAVGPYPADGFFGSNNFTKFDGILAMYHDQGLTPFKALSFGEGVNFTAGLKVIRTSPDHGTGYDIVGKGIADPSSFRKAVFLAIDTYRNRSVFLENYKPSKEKVTLDEFGEKLGVDEMIDEDFKEKN